MKRDVELCPALTRSEPSRKMSSAGGFFVQEPWASASSSRASGSGSGGAAARATRQAGEEVDAIVPRKLSSKQESRLMSYVEDKFNEVSRGYAKR
jgi:hypothetical protein